MSVSILSPLNPQEAVAFRSSASYSHSFLVVHEVSFPGNLQAPVQLCLEMFTIQKTDAKKHAFANAKTLLALRNTGHNIGKNSI